MYNGVCIIVLSTVYNEVYRKLHSKGVQYNVKEGKCSPSLRPAQTNTYKSVENVVYSVVYNTVYNVL